jgi:hypothetical protein
MTAQMAAMTPGGCTKVDPSFCASQPVLVPTTPGAIPGPGADGVCGPLFPGNCAQPLDLNITVFRADTLRGAPGVKVKIELLVYDPVSGNVRSSTFVNEGATDAQGKYFYTATAPAPAKWHAFRVTISTGSGFSFPSKSLDVQGFQGNNSRTADVAFAACPSGTNDVICEVGELQVLFTSVYTQQMAAWGQGGSQAPGSVAANFAFRQGWFFVHQWVPRNRILGKYWDVLSYGVCDLGIPPTDWPRLLDNYEQVQKIWNEIPWPSDGKTQKLFKHCANGLPIYNGQAIADVRLFSQTFSNYFPREDYKIRAEMAASYLLNIHMIFQCMVDELQKEAEALRKMLARLSLFRLIAAFIFAPLTGGAMLTLLVTETAQLVASQYTNDALIGDVKGVIAGVAKNASAGAVGIGAGLFAAGAALLIPLLVEGADPTVQRIANMFGPKVAEAAARDILGDVMGSGTVSGQGLTSAAGLGTAGATLAVEAMLSLISMQGIEKAQQFIAEVGQVKDFITRCSVPDENGRMCADIMPFVLWCVEAMMLDRFFDHVAAQAGISGVDVNRDVIRPTAREVESRGISVPTSAITPGAAPSTVVGGLAAAAGIGAGGFIALLLTGALAR